MEVVLEMLLDLLGKKVLWILAGVAVVIAAVLLWLK